MLGDKVNQEEVVFRHQAAVRSMMVKCDEKPSSRDTWRMETAPFYLFPKNKLAVDLTRTSRDPASRILHA